jgi:hypothetical protein
LESVEEYHQRVYVDAFKPSLWLGCAKPSVLFYAGVKLLSRIPRGEHTNTLRGRGNKVLQILVDCKKRSFQDGGEYYVQ